jgi:hypothetical protein
MATPWPQSQRRQPACAPGAPAHPPARPACPHPQVLCASNDAHDAVDPINPPEGVPVGERVVFEGYNGEPLPEVGGGRGRACWWGAGLAQAPARCAPRRGVSRARAAGARRMRFAHLWSHQLCFLALSKRRR